MKEKILIFIDNSRYVLDTLKDYFIDCSMKQLYFCTEEDFMEWKKENKVDYQYIIISDHGKFKRMDGLELLNSVKEKDAVKIIFSNFCESKAIEEAVLNNKIDAFFPKGYVSSLEQLKKLVKEHI